jgi:hypothetical protein
VNKALSKRLKAKKKRYEVKGKNEEGNTLPKIHCKKNSNALQMRSSHF